MASSMQTPKIDNDELIFPVLPWRKKVGHQLLMLFWLVMGLFVLLLCARAISSVVDSFWAGEAGIRSTLLDTGLAVALGGALGALLFWMAWDLLVQALPCNVVYDRRHHEGSYRWHKRRTSPLDQRPFRTVSFEGATSLILRVSNSQAGRLMGLWAEGEGIKVELPLLQVSDLTAGHVALDKAQADCLVISAFLDLPLRFKYFLSNSSRRFPVEPGASHNQLVLSEDLGTTPPLEAPHQGYSRQTRHLWPTYGARGLNTGDHIDEESLPVLEGHSAEPVAVHVDCPICGNAVSVADLLAGSSGYSPVINAVTCVFPCCSSRQAVRFATGKMSVGYVYAAGTAHFAGEADYAISSLKVQRSAETISVTLSDETFTFS